MKKTFLFCSLMLTALCFVGCRNYSTSSEQENFEYVEEQEESSAWQESEEPENWGCQHETNNTSVCFNHERDVHRYLRINKFVSSDGKISITESSSMGLCFNGRELTAAVRVCEFNEYAAYITAYAPVNGISYEFLVNSSQGTLSCFTDGTTYYIK